MATEAAGGAFEAIDSTLTIYALAHGMDLRKDPDRRCLTWYADGRERGVVIHAPEGDVVPVSVGIWKHGRDEPLHTEELARVAGIQHLLDTLPKLVSEGRARAEAL